MSRATRQSKILSIISTRDIETQDELVSSLQKSGYNVTQATISRDIKELGLIKTLTVNGKYKYVTKQKVDNNLSGKLLNIVRETVISVVTANNLCVVKTITDNASAVSSAIEQLGLDEVVGMVADRSTILIACNSANDAVRLSQEINRLLD